MRNNNRVVVDLNRVQYAVLHYVNQHGDVKEKKPAFSVCGQIRDPNEMAYAKNVSLGELAKELKIVDVWTPRLTLQLTANHSLVYTGEKALSIWREWNRRIFKDSQREMKKQLKHK